MLVVAGAGHHHRLAAAPDDRTDCPIAFVGSPRWPNPATPVVAGISGGEQDDEILGLAYDMASRCAAPLIVVHSWHDARNGHGEPRAEAEAFVEQGLARWRAKYPTVRVHGRVAGGPPAVVLPSLTHQAGLLIVGSGTSGIATLAVRYAHCPVLVVH